MSKRERVQNWMLEAGWRINDAQAQGINTAWVVGGTHPSGIGIGVAQPKPYPDLLAIEAGITLDEKARKAFEAMDTKGSGALLVELRLRLLQLGVEFNGIGAPLQMLRVSQFIYDDGLTKDAFLHRVQQVKDAAYFILMFLSYRLDQPPQENWQDNINVN
jgi:hypothetical protein